MAAGRCEPLEAISSPRQVQVQGTQQRKEEHSRLAFFNVILLVTASEGEELVVDVRHGGRICDGLCEKMPVICTIQLARKGAEQAGAGEKAKGQGRGRKMS